MSHVFDNGLASTEILKLTAQSVQLAGVSSMTSVVKVVMKLVFKRVQQPSTQSWE
jgi:hypothetical protein